MINFREINSLAQIDAAQTYANAGLAVFPCKTNKSPLTRKGFHDASTDPKKIAEWWTKYPQASIGTPTGNTSFVLDVDLPDGPTSLAALERIHGRLPDTLDQRTGGNGRHLFFSMPQGHEIRNSASKIGKGLDIRGIGGYVILPPSSHESGGTYSWTTFAQPAQAPEWLVAQICKPKASTPRTSLLSSRFNNTYLEKVLTEELGSICSAPKGTRNETLNRASFTLGQFLHCGLDSVEIERYLLNAAVSSGLTEIEALRTIRSGTKAGEANPRTPPASPPATAHVNSYTADEIDVKRWPVPSKTLFHGLAGRFTDFATKNSEADPVAVLATLCCRFGAEVGSTPFIFVGDKQRCCLNSVLVGQSSKARKGTSAVPVRMLFESSDPEWNPPQLSAGPLSSGEGLIYALRDERREWKPDKKGGTGQEVIVDPGIEDKRLFVLDQEFAGALSCTKRDGNTLSTIIRSLFDGVKVEPLTKTNKISATNPHVCIVTHITLHELHRKLDSVEAFNGFANRFLWLCVRRPQLVALPQPLDETELERFRGEIFSAVRFAQRQNQLYFSKQAESLWLESYPTLAADRPGLLGAILNRAETYTIRLALTYALLDQSNYIDTPHLEAALALWDCCEQSARYIFDGSSADPVERKILEALQAHQSLDSRALYSLFSNNLSKKKMESAISNLVADGKIAFELVKRGTGPGRPKKLFRLREQNESNEQKRPNEQ